MKINDKDNNYYNKNTDNNINIKNDSSSSTTTKRYSDNVFCLLYSDKKNLLDLYNALNNSSHTDTDNLSITTLKGGVYMMPHLYSAMSYICLNSSHHLILICH